MDLFLLQYTQRCARWGGQQSHVTGNDQTACTMWYCSLRPLTIAVEGVAKKSLPHLYWLQRRVIINFSRPRRNMGTVVTTTKLTLRSTQKCLSVKHFYQSTVRYWYSSHELKATKPELGVILRETKLLHLFIRCYQFTYSNFHFTTVQYWRALMRLRWTHLNVCNAKFFGVSWYEEPRRMAWWPLVTTLRYL